MAVSRAKSLSEPLGESEGTMPGGLVLVFLGMFVLSGDNNMEPEMGEDGELLIGNEEFVIAGAVARDWSWPDLWPFAAVVEVVDGVVVEVAVLNQILRGGSPDLIQRSDSKKGTCPLFGTPVDIGGNSLEVAILNWFPNSGAFWGFCCDSNCGLCCWRWSKLTGGWDDAGGFGRSINRDLEENSAAYDGRLEDTADTPPLKD